MPHADTVSGDNNLSFIETSALDASNVELAFQNILTGTPICSLYKAPRTPTLTSIHRNIPHCLQQSCC